jgi:hypothetical protein
MFLEVMGGIFSACQGGFTMQEVAPLRYPTSPVRMKEKMCVAFIPWNCHYDAISRFVCSSCCAILTELPV